MRQRIRGARRLRYWKPAAAAMAVTNSPCNQATRSPSWQHDSRFAPEPRNRTTTIRNIPMGDSDISHATCTPQDGTPTIREPQNRAPEQDNHNSEYSDGRLRHFRSDLRPSRRDTHNSRTSRRGICRRTSREPRASLVLSAKMCVCRSSCADPAEEVGVPIPPPPLPTLPLPTRKAIANAIARTVARRGCCYRPQRSPTSDQQ